MVLVKKHGNLVDSLLAFTDACENGLESVVRGLVFLLSSLLVLLFLYLILVKIASFRH